MFPMRLNLLQKKIRVELLTGALLDCIKYLQDNGFNARGAVSDDHVSDLSAYRILLPKYASGQTNLLIIFNKMKINLFFGSVHLIKNI